MSTEGNNNREWKSGQLIDFFETSTGTTPPKNRDDYYGGDIPFVKPPELQDNIILNTSDKLSHQGSAVARMLPTHSILVSCIGNLGKVGINTVPVAFNQQINAILPGEHTVPKFMFYQTLSPAFREQLQTLASGTTVPIVNKSKFNSINIVLPLLPEQKRIVAILDEAFAGISQAIANTEKNLTNARELFESYLNDVFTTKGEGWKEKTIGELVTLSRGHNPPKSQFVNEPRKGYVRFYQIRDGKTDKYAVYVPESPKLHRVEPNDILMVAYRHIGRVFRGVSGAFNVALCKLANKDTSILLDDYLYYIIPTDCVRGELLKQSERSLIPSMSVKHLDQIRIPLPPISEQERIIGQVISLNSHTLRLEELYQQKLDALSELKQSILQKAFSGELTEDLPL